MGPKGSGMIKWVKTELTSTFSMVDMGPISFHLGLKVKRNWHEKTIKLPQPGYIEKILAKFYPDKAHSINTPRKETVPLEQRSDRKACPSERERYQKMTVSLMFPTVGTRPNVAFVISVASFFTKNLSHQHTEAVKTILRYMDGLRQWGITYGGQIKLLVEGYSDSTWARDKESQNQPLASS